MVAEHSGSTLGGEFGDVLLSVEFYTIPQDRWHEFSRSLAQTWEPECVLGRGVWGCFWCRGQKP